MISIILLSAMLSIIWTVLFWNREPGISVLIFTAIAIFCFIYELHTNKKIKDKKTLFLTIPIILLASTYFIFNNLLFKTINLTIIILLTIIMCILTIKPKIKLPQFLYDLLASIMGSLECMEDVIKSFKRPKKDTNGEKTEKIKKIGKAVIVSLPIIIIVLILLMSADEIFASLFSGIFNAIGKLITFQGATSFIIRAAVTILVFLCIAGFLTNLIKENTMFNEKEENKSEDSSKICIESITVNTILTILNIMYLVFCFIQFTSLFTKIGNSADFDYAEYARQGFFQLMFVTFINFAVIFVANCNKKQTAKGQKDYTKFMNILMLVFTIVIIISAFYRMNLYEQQYGYTHLRLFVYFILATELIMIIPIIIYLIGKKINILKTSIVIGVTMYTILNFINIDKTIAKNNIDRYLANPEKREIDIYYLTQNTGTDAIEQIARLLEVEDKRVVENAERYLYYKKDELENKEIHLQELNLSELRAKKVLENLNLDVKKYYQEENELTI